MSEVLLPSMRTLPVRTRKFRAPEKPAAFSVVLVPLVVGREPTSNVKEAPPLPFRVPFRVKVPLGALTVSVPAEEPAAGALTLIVLVAPTRTLPLAAPRVMLPPLVYLVTS
jgi:hypothetical protein